MIIAAEPPTTTSKPEATEAGNYFVSNYPPFSFWKPDQVSAIDAVLQKPAPKNVPLGVYFHIPFCRKRCHFCYFKVYTDKNASEVDGYIDSVIEELTIYAAKPFIGGRKPSFVYFGGGTPSHLSSKQLARLVNAMKRLLPWDQVRHAAHDAWKAAPPLKPPPKTSPPL